MTDTQDVSESGDVMSVTIITFDDEQKAEVARLAAEYRDLAENQSLKRSQPNMYENIDGVRFIGLPGFAILFGVTDGTRGFSVIIWRFVLTFSFGLLDDDDNF